jgi:predicted nuclease with TOPRIM domain
VPPPLPLPTPRGDPRFCFSSQETEQFNALHHVHRQILDLEQKQTKLSKTVNELVDEYNRHETTFSDMLNSIDKLDEQKVDKVLLSTQVNDKANKDELRDKVSVLKPVFHQL